MKVEIKEVLKLLNKEIKWCEKNKKDAYHENFIKGLKQAVLLVENLEETETN